MAAGMGLECGLEALNMGTQHYDDLKEPAKRRIDRMRGREPKPDPDCQDCRNYDDKGYALRKRSEVYSDEEIVETVRHRGQVLPRRPGMKRNTSSMDNIRDGDRYRSQRSRGGGGGGSWNSDSDSEGSVPPRSRVRPKSASGQSQKRANSNSSTDSSELGSSTEEEKECRKIARKKWISAALASVATIHAAGTLYSSIEEHDKRIIQVHTGEISPEEAHKKQRAARWQDAAAIGLAALGIKGAISEWNEVKEQNEEHSEIMRKREEHHQKRLEHQRRMKAKEGDGYYKGRDGEWYYDGPRPQFSEQRKQIEGPRAGTSRMIEGPSGGSRSKSKGRYGSDASRSRSAYQSRARGDDRRSKSRGNQRRSTWERYEKTYEVR